MGKIFKDYGLAIGVAIGLAVLIRFFLIEAYRIPSTPSTTPYTMAPTLQPGDTIFVSKFEYGLRFPWSQQPFYFRRRPTYGEVVVFSPPGDLEIDYIKRVVALPGDRIELKNGSLVLNGVPLTLTSPPHSSCGLEKLPGITIQVCREPPLLVDFGPITIPEASVFVLGDTRTQSPDIRKQKGWGIIPISSIKARAKWIWLSFDYKRMFSRIL